MTSPKVWTRRRRGRNRPLEPGTSLKANEVNQSDSESLGAEMNFSPLTPVQRNLHI